MHHTVSLVGEYNEIVTSLSRLFVTAWIFPQYQEGLDRALKLIYVFPLWYHQLVKRSGGASHAVFGSGEHKLPHSIIRRDG